MKVKELARRMDIPAESYRTFRNQVIALYREGFLVKVRKGKYALGRMAECREGRIRVQSDGTAYLSVGKGAGNRLFIPLRDRGGAVDGDLVRFIVMEEGRGQGGRGRVVEILERAHPAFPGYLVIQGRRTLVRPANPRIDREVLLTDEVEGVEEGDLVMVEVRDWGKGGRFVYGTIVKAFGRVSGHEADILSIVLDHNLPLEFPPEVIGEAERIRVTVEDRALEGRTDLRSLPAFTIDPVDAKDYDDALSIEHIHGDLWRVGIHIADVAHFVKIGTAIDNEAMKRGNSVYLVDRAIPMLPERLSGGACSLMPGQDRLTVSVLVDIDLEGRVRKGDIRETAIRSRHRLTYDQAQAIIDGRETPDGRLSHDVRQLHRLSQAIRKARLEKGSLDFDRPESFVVLNEEGVPVDVRKIVQLGSHRLIEEFMVLANGIVAERLTRSELPVIYRVHEPPSEADLEPLGSTLTRFGLFPLWRKTGIEPATFQRILRSFRGRKEEAIINDLVLRSMKRAQYSTRNVGHFGLAMDLYTHYTSPIRRYSDLTVHRQVKALLHGVDPPYRADGDRLKTIAGQCSERERIADRAEWDSIDLKKVEFMERHRGEIFPGSVSGFVPVGCFVLLDPYFIEGMVPFRGLEDDYYDFIEDLFLARGRRTGRTFSLGDRVRVRVARTDRLRREIDFELIDHRPGESSP